ncbi:MAG TPA: glycosyltransferase [Longimicrobiales bacterium]|nr:glycosyltransferase [Longimicrobiales bacterium]
MKTIAISGNYFDEDVALLHGSESVRFLRLPFMEEIRTPDAVDNLLDVAAGADLLVFRLVGADPAAFIDVLRTSGRLGAFEKLPLPKVFWTQDSHHRAAGEASVQPYFQRAYIAHAAYLDRFDARTAAYLPCAYTASSAARLYQLNAAPVVPVRDVAFPHVLYAGAERNAITFAIHERLQRRNLTAWFGRLHGGEGGETHGHMLDLLRSSRIVLNVSLADDFNIRNFEAVAMNRAMLTNRVPDHDRSDLDFRRSWFFRRDLSNFDEALDAALADDASIDVWRSVPGRHMLIDRYAEIIRRELALDLHVRPPAAAPQPAASPRAIAVSDVSAAYSGADLLMHAIWTRLRRHEYRAAAALLPRIVRYPGVFRRVLQRLRNR